MPITLATLQGAALVALDRVRRAWRDLPCHVFRLRNLSHQKKGKVISYAAAMQQRKWKLWYWQQLSSTKSDKLSLMISAAPLQPRSSLRYNGYRDSCNSGVGGHLQRLCTCSFFVFAALIGHSSHSQLYSPSTTCWHVYLLSSVTSVQPLSNAVKPPDVTEKIFPQIWKHFHRFHQIWSDNFHTFQSTVSNAPWLMKQPLSPGWQRVSSPESASSQLEFSSRLEHA